MSDTSRDHGTLEWWGDRGYGFIERDDGSKDVFVHRSECELPEGEEPRIGDRVTFEIGADRRPGREPRVCAVKVHFVNGDGAQHGHLSRCRIEGAYAEWRGAIPRDGDSVTYTPGEGRNGKPAATNVSIVGAGTPNDTSTSAAVVFGSPAK